MNTKQVDIIKEKIEDFYSQGIPFYLKRDLDLGIPQTPARGNLVQVIVGVRRCGKTYRLYQEMQRLLDEGHPLNSILYFNFDDERLKPYDVSLFDEVIKNYYMRFPQAKTNGAFFFFDEIQEVPEWGVFLRRMVDTQVATIYVTGSSSKMLSTEIATEFRGRALSREMFPMSLAEFIRFHKLDIDVAKVRNTKTYSSTDVALLRNACDNYLKKGGFIATQLLDTSDAIQLLQEYANRTVNYDVIDRYAVTNLQAASLFLTRCIASSGRELSVNKIANDLKSRGVSISRETLMRLLNYYEEAYLLFSVREFSHALSDNPRSASKIYAADPALFGAFSPASSKDYGQRLETAVFNKLRRNIPSLRGNSISQGVVYKGSKKHEIDFVVGDAMQADNLQLIQVSASIDDEKTRKRELDALIVGMKHFGVNQSMLVTTDNRERIETENGTINVVPAWEWLL